MKNSKTLMVDHGILFLLDYEDDDAETPEYDDDHVTSVSERCVSVRVQHEVDGPVTVHLGTKQAFVAPDGAVLVFDGQIETKNGVVSLVSSGDENLMELRTGKTVSDLRIWVDDEAHATNVWVEAS